MKKKSTSRSAFFNLRVLIGLFVVLAGVCLALVGLGTRYVQAQQKSQAPINLIKILGLPPGFDCSKIHELGIDKQENMLAGLIMIACGYTEGGSPSSGSRFSGNGFSQWVRSLLPTPLFIGGNDVDVILPDRTFPHLTQSGTTECGTPTHTSVPNS